MGLFDKSASVTRFRVAGELPGVDPLGFIREKMKAFAFRDIDATTDMGSVGFVSIMDFLDAEFKHDMIFGDYVVATMRKDERKIPGAVVKKLCAKKVKERLEETGLPRLSRSQRMEIKEAVTAELVAKTVPSPELFDWFWDLGRNEVVLFTTSTGPIELFRDVFEKAFGITLTQEILCTVMARRIDEVLRPALATYIEGHDLTMLMDSTLGWSQQFLLWLKAAIDTVEFLPELTIGGDKTQVTCKAPAGHGETEIPEALFGLKRGLRMTRAKFALTVMDYQMIVGFSARDMGLKVGMASPQVVEDDDFEGAILDRAGLYGSLYETLDDLIGQFANLRFEETRWTHTQDQIDEWMEEAVAR